MTIFCPGQLPPGAAQAMAKEVKQWQESGLCSGVEISAGPGCDVAEAKKGKVYGFDDYPSLPLAGCRREPCCGCCYVPVVDDETRSEEPRREGMPLWKKILGILGSLWVIAVAASIFLSGCAGTAFKWSDARRIEAGMTKADVTSMVGAPNRVAALPNDATRYVWVWVNTMAGTTRTLAVDFDKSGRVIKAPPIPEEFQD